MSCHCHDFCCLTRCPVLLFAQFYNEYDAAYPIVLSSPPDVGDNGHWIASKSYDDDLPVEAAKYMKICLNGSGAISFVEYKTHGRYGY